MEKDYGIIKRYSQDEAGVAYIELAFTLFVMTTVLFGLVEITTYLRVKDKMNQTADQLGQALSTIPRWDPAFVDGLLPAASWMAAPYGVHVNGIFCSGTMGDVYDFNRTYGNADCALGTDPGGGAFVISNCSDAQLNGNAMTDELPGSQFVVLTASCRYKPYLNYLGLFNEMVVSSRSVTPVRYHMAWQR